MSKLCKDCKHMKLVGTVGMCYVTQNMKTEYVFGGQTQNWMCWSVLRSGRGSDKCNILGRWFVQRDLTLCEKLVEYVKSKLTKGK